MPNKVMILGHSRHGKDSFAEILRDEIGLEFCSSSLFAARLFIYDALKHTIGYSSIEECHVDRHNHRKAWYELICAYNKSDPARLARAIFKENDAYVGIRSNIEFEEAKGQGLFDLAIWVDASRRLPEEGEDSFSIDKSKADIVIDNNGGEEEFVDRVKSLVSLFR